MTKQEFLSKFYCKINYHNQGNINLVVITDVYRVSNNVRIDGVKSNIDIQETDMAVYDSNTMAAINTISWDNVIDFTKRAQLDCVAQKAMIEDFYPLNSTDNPDISEFYR
jgi:hypothetical protein